MQEMWIRSLVWEDPTRLRAAEAMYHNYSVCALSLEAVITEPMCYNYWSSWATGAWVLHQEKSLEREACASQLEVAPVLPQIEKSLCSNEDPASSK